MDMNNVLNKNVGTKLLIWINLVIVEINLLSSFKSVSPYNITKWSVTQEYYAFYMMIKLESTCC